MSKCKCKIKDRREGESQRDWLKRCMCQYHWMWTDYYTAKIKEPVQLELPFDKEEEENNA